MGLVRLIALFIVVALTMPGCTLLTADTALIGASSDSFTLQPGLWALSNANPCEAGTSQPSSQGCADLVRIDRSAEGAWRVSQITSGVPETIVFTVAPAGKGLFVAESTPRPSEARYYLVLRPHRGEAPPFRRLGVAVLDCQYLLTRFREPPVGVRLEHKDGKLNGCKAEHFAALTAAVEMAARTNRAGLRKQQAAYVSP